MERGDELLPAVLAEVMDHMINKRFLSEVAIAGSSAPDSIESLTRAGTSTELEPSAGAGVVAFASSACSVSDDDSFSGKSAMIQRKGV